MAQRDLVERARRGDHDAFASLVRASIERLEAMARLIVRDPELARDAVQEAYIRAWRDLPSLHDPDRFDAWLRRLATNACLDIVRRRRRRPVEVDIVPIDPPVAGDDLGLIADRDLLERAFRRLAVEQRAVLVLHYYVGLSMPELAHTLGIPLGTAQSRLGRALTAMRRALETEREPRARGIPRGQIA